MTACPWPLGSLTGVGEAMLEMAPVAGGLYAAGFAGDTLNTCWYLKRLLGDAARVSYVTRIGTDALSRQFLAFLDSSAIEVSGISQDSERTLGLYLIRLEGAERSFSYWRDQSAARRLADDEDALDAALQQSSLVHVSGITLAIIGATGRRNLFAALDRLRARGGIVSFDPNIRRRLWPEETVLRNAMADMFSRCDIALPSFDDEQGLWADANPAATVARIAAHGVTEIAVKNGAMPALIYASGTTMSVPASEVPDIRDTTGAGDAFNAGYLAARHKGLAQPQACAFAHCLAGEVVRHPGALAPTAALDRVGAVFARLARA